MFMTFVDDNTTPVDLSEQENQMDQEEIKPTGDGARSERRESAALRELDHAVAERVMGYRWFHCVAATGVERNQLFTAEQVETWRAVGWSATEIPSPPPADQFNDDSDTPRYSSSIVAAMQVVGAAIQHSPDNSVIKNLGFAQVRIYRYSDGTWHVAFTKRGGKGVTANTLPEAICRAALSLVGDPQNQETK